jgi:hypothetical protein
MFIFSSAIFPVRSTFSFIVFFLKKRLFRRQKSRTQETETFFRPQKFGSAVAWHLESLNYQFSTRHPLSVLRSNVELQVVPRIRVARFFLIKYTKTGGGIYQMAIKYTKCSLHKYTKWPKSIQNGHKIYQHFPVPNLPKLGILVWKCTIWQPCLEWQSVEKIPKSRIYLTPPDSPTEDVRWYPSSTYEVRLG